MSEIEVVVDIRRSPDGHELIIVKQKIAFNDAAEPIGPPVETMLGMIVRKAQISVYELAESGYGFVVAATVKNVGNVPLPITDVAFEHRYRAPHPVKVGSIHALNAGGNFRFIQKDMNEKGPLLVGEERTYYLPHEMRSELVPFVLALELDQFWIAAYSGKEEIGRVAGPEFSYFFEKAGIRFDPRALPVFQTLPEAGRIAIVRHVGKLHRINPTRWEEVGAKPIISAFSSSDSHTYAVQVGPDLRVIVTPENNTDVLILDILRWQGEGHGIPKVEGTRK